MKKFYHLFLVFLISCSPKIVYVGNYLGASKQVDVYVDARYITRDFEVIGIAKEDLINTWQGKNYDEIVAKKAIEKAKQCGADAIFFSNYYLRPFTSETRRDSKTIFSDTSIASSSSVKNILDPQSTGKQILFLKYK